MKIKKQRYLTLHTNKEQGRVSIEPAKIGNKKEPYHSISRKKHKMNPEKVY